MQLKMEPALTLIRGCPGSGKSTLARELLTLYDTKYAIHLEADQYFYDADGNYNWTADKLGAAHGWCQATAAEHLAKGHFVVVSNTFTTPKEMKPYFQMIQAYGKNPTVICMQNAFGSVHGVPQASMDAMRKRFVFDISEMFLEKG